MPRNVPAFLIVLLSAASVLRADNLLLNANFAHRTAAGTPRHWEARGPVDAFTFDNGTVTLKGTASPDAMLILQRNIPLTVGTDYEMLYQVKGSSPDGQYRVYFEVVQSIDGKDVWKSYATAWAKPPTQWQTNGFNFTFPPDVRTSHLVVQIKPGGDVSFRELSLKPFDASSGRQQFGGTWQLYRGSHFETADDGTEPLVVHPNTAGCGAILKGIPLTPGTSYTLHYAVKGRGDAGNSTGFYPFQVRAAFDGIPARAVSDWDDTWNSSFQNKQFTFTVPADAKSGATDLECVIQSAGSILFTDFALAPTQVTDADRYVITLDSPNYRDTIYASMPVKAITGSVSTDASITDVSLTLMLGAECIYAGHITPTNNTAAFSIPAADLANGDYVLAARLITSAKETPATVQRTIRKLPAADMEVVPGPDRNVYINGKVFFPIAVWTIAGGNDPNAAMLYAARHGVNLTIAGATGETQVLKTLDAAESCGLKIALAVGHATTATGPAFDHWKQRLTSILTPAVRRHPALLCYFLVDEPAWAGIPFKYLQTCYDTLKTFDPYHPVWINAAPRGAVDVHKRYSQAADIYGVDIYPIPVPGGHSGLDDKSMNCVGKYAQRMTDAVNDRKPVWMALQGFSWTYIDGRKDNTRREAKGYPTAVETRFMAYDALIHNATSVGYWGTQHIFSADFYDVLFAVTHELYTMSGLLTEGQPFAGITTDNPAIDCRAYAADDNRYMIALNTTDEPQVATFSGIAGTEGTWTVFTEDRSVTVSKATFADTFDPFAVHIYGSAPLPAPADTLPAAGTGDTNINPFAAAIERRLSAVMYDGTADWIWDKTGMNLAGSKATLARVITIDQPVTYAELLITADDMGTAYLDGKPLGTIDGWSQLKKFNLTDALSPGTHLLTVQVADGGNLPCGMLADLAITFADGTSTTIVSDPSWHAIPAMIESPLTPASANASPPAVVVAPYGSGAWGKRLQLPQPQTTQAH